MPVAPPGPPARGVRQPSGRPPVSRGLQQAQGQQRGAETALAQAVGPREAPMGTAAELSPEQTALADAVVQDPMVLAAIAERLHIALANAEQGMQADQQAQAAQSLFGGGGGGIGGTLVSSFSFLISFLLGREE